MMLRAVCLAMTISVLGLTHAYADGPSELGANAALKYWQAFAQLPKLSDDEQKLLFANCGTMPLDAQARGLVARADHALLMMHRGAGLPRCEWAVGSEEGIEALLPHAQAARVLAAVACLRARIRFEDGRNAEAVDDVLDGMALGRHLSQGGLLIPELVHQQIEKHMIESLAVSLPKLNCATLTELKRRLGALPAAGNSAEAMRLEQRFSLDWFANEVRKHKDEEDLQSFLGRMEGSPEKGRKFFAECGGTVDGVLKFIELTRESYTRLGSKLDLPLDQFNEEYKREVKRQSGNPVFRMLFPGLDRMRWSLARAEVRRALLAAAIAVQLDGPDALKNHLDPVTGSPFDHQPFDGGFELRSRWKTDESIPAHWQMDDQFNKPPVLIVGKRAR